MDDVLTVVAAGLGGIIVGCLIAFFGTKVIMKWKRW